MMRGTSLLVVALAMVLGAANSARAEVVLDASYHGVPESSINTPGQELAQTFTVGVSGVLDHIEVNLIDVEAPGGTFTIRLTSDGVPVAADSGILASQTIQQLSPDSSRYYSFDVSSSGIQVYPNEVLAFGISANVFHVGGGVQAMGALPYGGGAAFTRGTPPPNVDFELYTVLNKGVNLNFRTFVATAPIPEPSSLVLAGLGILCTLGYLVCRIVGRRKAI